MSIADTLLLAVGALAVVVFLHYRLMHYVQPLRLKLAKRGEKFINKPGIPYLHRELMKMMVENAYNPWFLVSSVFLLPFCAIYLALSRQKRIKIDQEWHQANSETRNEYRQINSMFLISVFAANPLFGLIFASERMSLAIFLVLAGRTIRSADLILNAMFGADANRSRKRTAILGH